MQSPTLSCRCFRRVSKKNVMLISALVLYIILKYTEVEMRSRQRFGTLENVETDTASTSHDHIGTKKHINKRHVTDDIGQEAKHKKIDYHDDEIDDIGQEGKHKNIDNYDDETDDIGQAAENKSFHNHDDKTDDIGQAAENKSFRNHDDKTEHGKTRSRKIHHSKKSGHGKTRTKISHHNLNSGNTGNTQLTDRGARKFELLGRTDMFEGNRTCQQKLPDAIIFGVMKAGTEAFSTYLTINPYVAMSVNVRSTLYFTSNYNKGLAWYRSQMTCSTPDQVTIEKAPQYFSESHAPERIHRMNKDIKLIMLVRNPVDRAISHYLQVKNSHPKAIGGRTFEQMVFSKSGHLMTGSGFIALSRYSIILKRWYKYFKKSQILVLDGDRFKTDQIKVLSKAEDFLGIPNYITSDKFIFDESKGFYCLNVNGEAACLGNGKGRTHPDLKDKYLNILKAHFKPYNQELYKMTGKNFGW